MLIIINHYKYVQLRSIVICFVIHFVWMKSRHVILALVSNGLQSYDHPSDHTI